MDKLTSHHAGTRRWAICLMFGFSCLVLADKAAEPSDDFLAYLGDMEDNDDNWSDFADQHEVKPDSHAGQASSTSSTSSQNHAETSTSRRSRT